MRFKKYTLKSGGAVYYEEGDEYSKKQLERLESKASVADMKFGKKSAEDTLNEIFGL